MFRSQLGRATSRIRQRLPRRNFTTNAESTDLPPVRVLGPVVWCFATVSILYVSCAAYEVLEDARENEATQLKNIFTSKPPTYADTEVARNITWRRKLSSGEQQLSLLDLLSTNAWKQFEGTNKVILTTVGANVGLFALSQVSQPVWMRLAHYPAGARNYTLLTSMFGHSGLLHLGLNMYGMINFGPPVAMSATIQGSGSHFLAFYLSAGVLASLANHMTAIWPNPAQRFSLALGASGGIMAIVGAFGMSYPNAGIGLILIPGSIPAQQALGLLAAFEVYGLFRGFKTIRIAHSAHLAGLAIGAAYAHFNGRKYIWTPTRKFAFNQMRRLNMI